MPPIQWEKLRQNSVPWLSASTSVRIVEPVVVKPETVSKKASAKDGISPEMAARRLNAQTSEQTLTAQADYTLHNDAGLEALQAAAARLCERLQAEGGVTAAL
mgnify:FL=1